MSDKETSNDREGNMVRDMDDGKDNMVRDIDNEETTPILTYGPVNSPNMYHPGPSMPRDLGSISPSSSRSSNSSMAWEEQWIQ
jgi:hypothetical protein